MADSDAHSKSGGPQSSTSDDAKASPKSFDSEKEALLRRFRPQSPSDLTEVALAHRAAQLAVAFQGRLPLASELGNVTEELGVELASALFLKTVHESRTHGVFERRIRSYDFSGWNERFVRLGQVEVVVVASNLFQSGRKWGDHCEDWRAWARDLGFRTETIETDPQRSVASNARLIFDFLSERPHPNRILITYGQGAAELRYLLHRRCETMAGLPECLSGLRGWINVCGAFHGCSSSRLLQENRLRRLLARLRMKVAGRNPLVLAETSTRFPLWRRPLPALPLTSIVSIVGVPYPAQASYGAPYFSELAAAFPNDGAVTVLEACANPGRIITVPGMTHAAANSALEPVLKRTLAILADELEQASVDDAAKKPVPRTNS